MLAILLCIMTIARMFMLWVSLVKVILGVLFRQIASDINTRQSLKAETLTTYLTTGEINTMN